MTGVPISSLEDYRRASDDDLTADVRGLVAIDRAVARFHRGVIRPVHVTPGVAEQLDWPLCTCGRGGIRPGACVTYRGDVYHVECAIAAAVENGARAAA